MATGKANYGGGKTGKALEGMVTRSPPANDKSRAPIGEKYEHVNTGAVRSEPSKQPPTIGPRSA